MSNSQQNQQRQLRTYAPLQLLDPKFLGELAPNEANDNAVTAVSADVEAQCFQVLSLIEQLYHPPKTEEELNQMLAEFDTADSINDIDGFLRLLSENAQDSPEPQEVLGILESEEMEGPRALSEAEIVERSRDIIIARIKELMSNEAVKRLLESEITSESTHYKNFKTTLERIRDLKFAIKRGKEVMRQTYFRVKRRHGKLLSSGEQKIKKIAEVVKMAEAERAEIEAKPEMSSGPGEGLLIAQRLLRYKRQIEEKGFALTPSRQRLIETVAEYAMAGQKVFLVGSTGTGKTELAFYVANELTGGFEMIPWHEGTVMRDVMGQMSLRPGPNGGVESVFKPGPLPRAMSQGFAAIHEEFTGGSTRSQLGMKPYMNLKPGQTYTMPETNGMVHCVDDRFFEIFTGNPKDDRTKDREELDPAILRMMKGLTVSYMPAEEMTEVALANLMEITGLTRLSYKEIRLVIKLAQAAQIMQFCHDGILGDEMMQAIKDATGIDNTRVVKNFLDTGTFFSLFARYEFERCKGKSFEEYIEDQLQAFIQDPKNMDALEEREIILAILKIAKVIKGTSTVEKIKVIKGKSNKPYTLPSQLGVAIAEKEFRGGDPFAAAKAAEAARIFAAEEAARQEAARKKAEEEEAQRRRDAAAEAARAAEQAAAEDAGNKVKDKAAEAAEAALAALIGGVRGRVKEALPPLQEDMKAIEAIMGATKTPQKAPPETFKNLEREEIFLSLNKSYDAMINGYQSMIEKTKVLGRPASPVMDGQPLVRSSVEEFRVIKRGNERVFTVTAEDGNQYPIPTWQEVAEKIDDKIITALQRGKLANPKLLLVPSGVNIKKLTEFMGISEIQGEIDIDDESMRRFVKIGTSRATSMSKEALVREGVIRGWEIMVVDGTQNPPISNDKREETSLSGWLAGGHDILSLEAAIVAYALLGKSNGHVLSSSIQTDKGRVMLGVKFDKDSQTMELEALGKKEEFLKMWPLMTPVINIR